MYSSVQVCDICGRKLYVVYSWNWWWFKPLISQHLTSRTLKILNIDKVNIWFRTVSKSKEMKKDKNVSFVEENILNVSFKPPLSLPFSKQLFAILFLYLCNYNLTKISKQFMPKIYKEESIELWIRFWSLFSRFSQNWGGVWFYESE